MTINPRQALNFFGEYVYLKAFFAENNENNFVRIWYRENNPLDERWWICIEYKGEAYTQGQPSVYQALDAANDWWFHQQRKEQMDKI